MILPALSALSASRVLGAPSWVAIPLTSIAVALDGRVLADQLGKAAAAKEAERGNRFCK